jgi:predicted amidohydrolase YtcJ
MENNSMQSLIVHGGPILTMNREQPVVEAVGFIGNRIHAVGSLDQVREAIGRGASSIDLRGRTATPGLYDAHAHITMTGFARQQVSLWAPEVTSIGDIQRAIGERNGSTAEGKWIVGQGYDQASLVEQRHPVGSDLDEVASDRPVLLWRSCHHIVAVNSVALKLAGIGSSTPDPDGGTIDRDASGEPTGVLRESAIDLVKAVIPSPGQEDIESAIVAGGLDFRHNGVTSVTEAGIRLPEEFAAFQALRQRGELPIRTYLMMIINDTLDSLIDLGIKTGFGDDWLRIGPAKLFSDGSIGGRTARMRRPYEGEPENFGLWMESPEKMKADVLKAHRAGFQIGIHAIGDAAIELILDAYREAQVAFPRENARHRIEHCSVVDDGLLDRIAEQQVIPIPGTTFLHYTRPAYEQNIGRDRYRYAYAMKTFAERGIIAAASSDAPVVPTNPMLGIQTMVTRLDSAGVDAWTEERISVDEAIRAYTFNAAYASFDEGIKGTLAPGFLADMTIYAENLHEVEPSNLAGVKIDHTIVDGEVVYSR